MRLVKASIVTVSILLSAFCLLLIVSVRAVPVQPGGGGAAAVGNGDTNGDGVIDVSDAVHLLLFLFRSGEPPAAVAESPELVAGVELIGTRLEEIAEVVDSNLSRIAAESERPCRERFGRFVDNGNGTVTDTCTGLMWQQVIADLNGNGVADAQDQMGWQQATNAAAALRLAGHTDWRLPTAQELEALFDPRWNPSIDPLFGTFGGGFWTSSVNPAAPSRAWSVSLSPDGRNVPEPLSNPNYAIAVREP